MSSIVVNNIAQYIDALVRFNNNDETKMFQPADQVNLRGFISELINEYNTKCAQRDNHLSDFDYFRLALFSIFFFC
ncbi:unnamed protein product [Rotaria sp. Silwood2]|nr:unnamed protein product [Rotaria sp. Silwood2]